MSIEASFSPASYPAIRNVAQAKIERQSRASGHAAGYAAGLQAAAADLAAQTVRHEATLAREIADGKARVDTALAVLAVAAEALTRRTVPVVSEAQDAIVATAIELAEAIIGRELSNAETSSRSALHRALADVDPAMVLAVRMNPADLAALDEATIASTGVTLTADAALGRGDAISEFADGYLDARVMSAFRRARAAILEEGP